MSFDKYPNLPGMLTEFKDGGLQLKQEADPPVTGSMLILGTAIDGPVMEPVAVEPSTVSALIGPAVSGNGIPNGATLLPAFEKAWKGGCRDIRIMRISGKESAAKISTAEVSITEPTVVEEQLGVAEGNDETTITLSNTPIVSGSVLAKANGTNITTGVVVNLMTGDVTIKANKCDAGAPLAFDYEHYELTPEGALTVTSTENAGTIKLSVEYDIHTVASISDGTYNIAVDQYSVNGKEIEFISGAVNLNGDAIIAGTSYTVTYVGKTGHIFQATESGAFVSKTSEQEFSIDFAPIPGSFHLYSNGSEVLDVIAYRVDGTAKKVYIKKEFFDRGSVLEGTYQYNKQQKFVPEILLSSVFGGSVYNAVTVKVEDVKDNNDTIIGKRIVISKPESKKSQIAEEPLTFSSLDYPNFRLLVNAINAHPLNNVVKAVTFHDSTGTGDLLPTTVTYFSGGEDGLNMSDDQMFKALSGERNNNGEIVQQGAYQLLEDYNVDEIVVSGIYADSILPGKFQNFAYELAMFCAYSSFRNKTVHGFISLKPPVDTKLADIQSHAKKQSNFGNNWFMRDQRGNIIKDNDGNPIDIGAYISVIAGPQPTVNVPSLGRHFADGVVLYAALNTVLDPHSAPTNKLLPGAIGLRYRYSNAQLDALTSQRLVTFKTKQDGKVYVVDGMTSAQKGSDYARLTTVQVVKATIDEIREVCDPFIGESNTTEQRNAMSSLIEKRLSGLKEAGVILDYDFQIISSLKDQLLGQAKIELTIVPPQELRRITTVVSVKPTL